MPTRKSTAAELPRGVSILHQTKNPRHIERLITQKKLPKRFPEPNEALAVPPSAQGLIPLPRNFKTYAFKRDRPSVDSTLYNLEQIVGANRTRKERRFEQVFAVLDDRTVAKTVDDAWLTASEVMHETYEKIQRAKKSATSSGPAKGKRRYLEQSILLRVLQRERRRLQRGNRGGRSLSANADHHNMSRDAD